MKPQIPIALSIVGFMVISILTVVAYAWGDFDEEYFEKYRTTHDEKDLHKAQAIGFLSIFIPLSQLLIAFALITTLPEGKIKTYLSWGGVIVIIVFLVLLLFIFTII